MKGELRIAITDDDKVEYHLEFQGSVTDAGIFLLLLERAKRELLNGIGEVLWNERPVAEESGRGEEAPKPSGKGDKGRKTRRRTR